MHKFSGATVAKWVIITAVIVSAFVMLTSYGRKFLSALGILDNAGDKEKKEQDKKTLKDIEQECDSSTEDMSYAQSMYDGYVSKITTALDNYLFDDQDAVRDVFHQMKNKRDVLELVRAFGTRSTTHLIPPSGFSGGLVLWLNTGNTPFNDLTGDVNKILEASHIDYKF